MNNQNNDTPPCYFFRFGLIVTGKCEEKHLAKLFRSLTVYGCTFQVIRRIGQLNPKTSSKKRKVKQFVGSHKKLPIPEKDVYQISELTRNYLKKNPCSFVLLIDDLEYERTNIAQQVFDRYRQALDYLLDDNQKQRVSVHFLVNMLEAYYFADVNAVNSVLSTDLKDYEGDVETIRHPKGELKQLYKGFDEIEHGGQILSRLDVEQILSNPETCASLRTLYQWCWKSMGLAPTDKYQLVNGKLSEITQ
jgi:uncharacterized protein YktA (UPF0223 family)